MNIYIIRHAQTTANEKGKVFSGATDVSLSKKGIEDTKLLSQNSLWEQIEHVYITPLIRTHQTADILFDKTIKRTIVPELAEMNFGDYEGKIMTPENADDPVFYNWVNNPEQLTFPNGENLLEHAESSLRALSDIAQNKEFENIAIVSHATTIRLLLSKLMTGNIKCFRKIPCDNGCVSLLSVDENAIKIKYINAPL